MNKIQFLVGVLLFIGAIYFLYQSLSLGSSEVKGILLGQGSILLFWGLRELICGIYNKETIKEEDKK